MENLSPDLKLAGRRIWPSGIEKAAFSEQPLNKYVNQIG
jgi:hypothetical protein